MNLTQAQREAVEQCAAACCDKSEDMVRLTFTIRTYLERQLDLIAKRDAQILEVRR